MEAQTKTWHDVSGHTMARQISRGIRIPLSGILGWAEVLEVGSAQNLLPQFKDIGHDLRTCGERLMELADRLQIYLEVQQLSPGSTQESEGGPSPFADVQRSVEEVVSDKERTDRRTGDLQIQLRDGCIHMQSKHLQLLVAEIVDNAIKFSQKGQAVTVTSSYENGRYQIIVTDSGRGMPPEQVSAQSDSFQCESAPGDDQGGGFGLAIVKRLCQLNGGRLRIESCEGVGTRVMVSIPGLVCGACTKPSRCPRGPVPTRSTGGKSERPESASPFDADFCP